MHPISRNLMRRRKSLFNLWFLYGFFGLLFVYFALSVVSTLISIELLLSCRRRRVYDQRDLVSDSDASKNRNRNLIIGNLDCELSMN